jgi:acetyl esterase/lipase
MNTTIVRPATLPTVGLVPAARAFADGSWLTRQAMRWFRDAYAPDLARGTEPTASPSLASLEHLEGLSPAGPAAAQQLAANADDGEPTWEDAEWQ